MKIFGRKNKPEVTIKFVMLNKDFAEMYKKISKDIKKDELTDKSIYEFRFICESLKTFLKENKSQLIQENEKLTEQNFSGYINQMDIQINWCDKQIEFRKEILKSRDSKDFKDKLDEVVKRRE